MAVLSSTCHLTPPFLSNQPPLILSLLPPQTQTHFPFKTLRLIPYCSKNATQSDSIEVLKKKRKPRPSFYEQIREKWSLKLAPQTTKFPWQTEEQPTALTEAVKEEEGRGKQISGVSVVKTSEFVFPLSDGSEIEETQIDSEAKINQTWQEQSLLGAVEVDNVGDEREETSGLSKIKKTQLHSEAEVNKKWPKVRAVVVEGLGEGSEEISACPISPSNIDEDHLSTELNTDASDNNLILAAEIDRSRPQKTQLNSRTKINRNYHVNDDNAMEFRGDLVNDTRNLSVGNLVNLEKEITSSEEVEEKAAAEQISSGFPADEATLLSSDGDGYVGKNGAYLNGKLHYSHRDYVSFGACQRENGVIRMPWMQEADSDDAQGKKYKSNHTELAEKVIPEHELKRLRNEALRMQERIKVGAEGITLALVGTIHEKWKIDEVVKLKFEGPLALNMRRTHEILERRTGGLVIWRSGSSAVLFRGMAYKLHCVKSHSRQSRGNSENVQPPETSAIPDYPRLPKNLSEEEVIDLSELNNLLDTLGPRFLDWTGREPLPVDADLLPGVVLGYKPPFRLLPCGVRHCLRNKEMTFFRRLARTMPPHFALGRSRELEGLAGAMVTLWEKSAIAKIAIKRGVPNTCNERMAEELKRLTGGILLSRNKEYIVFYRGNDFLPPVVKEALKEREKLTVLNHEEEEVRREASALISSDANASRSTMVAGTLAETVAATSRWGKQPTSQELEGMMEHSAVSRQASLVKYLEKKLALAKGKVTKAEKALAKVQQFLEPAELPTDLETITDEERFLLHKMGLSMKPYLLLGRRGVFNGTIQNMHLHWKFRELVKIIVKGKNFAQVKHIAVSLEAESGGVLVSIDKTTKGYAIILYRGKNYQRPLIYKPYNLLTKRQALAQSIELQRREALKHHISDLQEKIGLLKSELEHMRNVEGVDEETFYARLYCNASDDDGVGDHDDLEEDEDV
ncbi:hypothetical protein Ancab_017978 [Ancistrocladus abbreviatus]